MERKLICGSHSWNLCDPRSGYLQPCRDIRWGASLGLHRHANFTLTAFARAHRDQWRFLDEDLQLPEVSVGINAPVWQRKTERRYSVRRRGKAETAQIGLVVQPADRNPGKSGYNPAAVGRRYQP